jgi:hypothetical protein
VGRLIPCSESRWPEGKSSKHYTYPDLTNEATLKLIGGSDNDDFCNVLVNQVCSSLWKKNSDPDARQRQTLAVVAAMMGMQPRDELEGMLIGQLIASHNAAMECYRRAMISEQTFEGRRENLTQANKLSRSYAALVEALDRHRGKGQQFVKVEHVIGASRATASCGRPCCRRRRARLIAARNSQDFAFCWRATSMPFSMAVSASLSVPAPASKASPLSR